MEFQKNLLKVFNILFPFADFTYLLQQEEYSLQRVFFWLPRFFFRRNFQNRGNLVYTQRAKFILSLSSLIFWSVNFYFSNIFLLIISFFTVPIYIIIANFLVSPIYYFLKERKIGLTKKILNENKKNLKVIAITGSFGKTTVKNFIEQMVKYNFKTQMVPGNINSAIGISDWILKNYKLGTEVLITEVDSYKPGRIKKAVELLDPDIAVLTNIGDQHLERYKTKRNLAETLFELFLYSKKDCLRLTDTQTLAYLKSENYNIDRVKVVNELNSTLTNLSLSNVKNSLYATYVSDYLGVPDEYIKHITKKLNLPDRRQIKKDFFGFHCIDDSYNISFSTAIAGINEAKASATKENKKLLVITAGIPELGIENIDSNKKLARILEKNSDKVFLFPSIFYKEMYSEFKDKDKVEVFKKYKDAVSSLVSKYNPDKWFVLIQPELTDLYY